MALLTASKVTKKFSGITAVNSVDLIIEQGEIVGLIGPNGAGKTTFFNCITGFFPCTSGRVEFDGTDITSRATYLNCRGGMARTFQIVQPFGKLTAVENVMVGAFSRCTKYSEAENLAGQWLEFVGLGAKSRSIVADLNIGDQRRLEMARALATGPKLLLLDEVMAGLTPTEIESVVSLVGRIRSELGITILMIEHIMAALMRLSDRVMVMDQGAKIAEGTPSEISSNQRVIESYLGSAYKKHA